MDRLSATVDNLWLNNFLKSQIVFNIELRLAMFKAGFDLLVPLPLPPEW